MILGIDIGATKTRLGRLEGGRLLKSGKIATNPSPDGFLGVLRELIGDSLGSDQDRIEAIGIGGGYVLDRRIVGGARHLTGELWTLPVLSFGQPDILLNSSSGPGIVRTARMLLDQGQPSTLSSLDSFDTEEVFQQAELGDVLCKSVMENAARNMALAVVSVLVVVDPDVVLIGGGMASNDDCLINPIRRTVAQIAYLDQHRHALIRKAELWDEAVLYGAISLFDE